MSYFGQQGDAFYPTAGRETLLDTLPTGNYVVAESLGGLFYRRIASFPEPPKLYGHFQKTSDRILRTFLDRDRATGALFAGEKGSGKSELARLISRTGYDMGIPTILINAPWAGDAFANLLACIEQPAIVLMDEFEKVYDSDAQEGVLNLLDGGMTSKKLFVLTVNNKWKIDSHMRNRPGRLFYALDFEGLDSEFVREYCVDNLDNQAHVDPVVKISTMFEKFNFDIMKALVEEMNRYEEDPFEALKLLNAKPVEYEDSSAMYDVKIFTPNGTEVQDPANTSSATPLNVRGGIMQFWIPQQNPDDDADDEYPGEEQIVVKGSHVKKLDAEKGFFEFVNDEGFRVVFLRQPPQSFDYRSVIL